MLYLNEDAASLLEDAAYGRLPAVSWIDPNFKDFNLIGSSPNDDHPPSDMSHGQELALLVYTALATGPQWDKTLLLVFHDKHGLNEPRPAPDRSALVGWFAAEQAARARRLREDPAGVLRKASAHSLTDLQSGLLAAHQQLQDHGHPVGSPITPVAPDQPAALPGSSIAPRRWGSASTSISTIFPFVTVKPMTANGRPPGATTTPAAPLTRAGRT